jgi:hypothetical protein
MYTHVLRRVALSACAVSILVGFTALPAGEASAAIYCQPVGTNDCWYDHTGLILPPAGVSDPSAELLYEQLFWVVPSAPSSYLMDCDTERLYLPYLRMANSYGDAGLGWTIQYLYPDGSFDTFNGDHIGNLKSDAIFNDYGTWVQYNSDFTNYQPVPYIQVHAGPGVQWRAKWNSVDQTTQHLYPTYHELWATNSQGSNWCPIPPSAAVEPQAQPAPPAPNQKPFGEIVLSIVDGRKYGLFAYAIDPETGASPRMRVTMDGVESKEYDWNHTWPEMPARTGWGSTQSLVYLALPPSGSRNVCVDAQDPQSGEWVNIGCRGISVK